jgi:hypothetical protein
MAGLMDFMMNPVGGLGAGQQAGGLGGFQDLAGALGPALMVPQAQRGAVFGIGAARAGEQREMRQTQNATAQFLIQRGIAKDPEEAMALVQQPELMRFILKDGGDEYSKRAQAAEQYGLTKDDPRWQSFVLGVDAPNGGGAVNYSVVPTYGEGPNGETLLGVPGSDASFKVLDTPGFKPLSPYDKSYQRSQGGAEGKDEGEAVAAWRRMSSQMPGIEKVVKDLDTLAGSATYTPGGKVLDAGMRWLDMEPRDAAVARTKYMAMVDNQVLPMLRDTFGAQFTVQEGESLRATLGAPDKTPTEKKAVLTAFIEQKRRNIEALALQTGQEGSGGGTPDFSTMTDEQLREYISGK